MSFWIDIETLAGAKLGEGPISTALSWENAPRLSQSGTFSFTMPAGDPNAALCKPRRVARCYQIMDGAVTEVGAGVIDRVELSAGPQGGVLRISGNDLLRELTWKSTVGLALLDIEQEVPAYVADVTYTSSAEWSSYPQTIRLGDRRFLYIGAPAEFTTINLTLTVGNAVVKRLEIQYWNEAMGGWAAAQYTDGTAVGDTHLAYSGAITIEKLDGWGIPSGYTDYIVRLWSPEGDLDEITIGGITITRYVETDTALASIMAYAPAGWSLVDDAPNSKYTSTASGVYLPAAGRNVLECLNAVARVTGEQFRLGTGRTIEWLRTDTPDSGITAVGPVDPNTMGAADERALLVSLSKSLESFDLGSRVIPLGGGDEDRVTLALCTRTPPVGYTLSTANNYIERAAATTYLGAVVEMPIEDLRIKATDTSNVQGENAANALYDWALEYLNAHSATADADVPTAYSADVVRMFELVRPGELMTVRYDEWRDGYHALAVDASLVVLEPTIRIGQDGVQVVAITFATQARWPKGDQDVTVDLINQALSNRGSGSGGVAGGSGGESSPTAVMSSHDIVGAYHWVSGQDGQIVGVHPNNVLTLLSLQDWLDILGGFYIGRRWGAHVGLFKYRSDEGFSIEYQTTDSGGDPIISTGSVLDVPNSFWVAIGREGESQITYSNDGTRDGIEKPGTLAVPADVIVGYLGIEYGATLPDAFDRDPGYLFALVSPGDPYSFVLYMRDNLDSWQRLIGAGYAAVHSHTSDETGGLISGTNLEDPAYVQDEATYAILYDETDTDEPITTGLFAESDGDTPLQLEHALQIGDVTGGDYSQIATDGRLTLVGGARVIKHISLDLSGIGLGPAAPAVTRLGNTYGYEFDIGENGYVSFEMPHDWDSTTALEIALHVYTNEAYATNSGEIRFKGDWSAIAEDANEAVDSPTHSGTMTGADLNIATTAKGLQEYVLGTIAAASLAADDMVSILIERIALTAGNNPTADPVIIQVEYEYTANSLGEAT